MGTENPAEWPTGAGEMARRVRAFAGTSGALGEGAVFSDTLRAAVELCLGCGFPAFVWWGGTGIEFHNDAAAARFSTDAGVLAFGAPVRGSAASPWSSVLDRVFVSGEPVFETSLTLGSHGPHAVSLAPVHDPQGRVEAVLGTVVPGPDDAPRFEEDVRVEAFSELAPAMLWETDAEGREVVFNKRWLEYSGTTAQRFDGRALVDFIHPDDAERSMRLVAEGAAARQPVELEHRLRRADGVYRWFLARQLPVLNAKGEIVRWLGAATEMHEQRLALETARVACSEAERASQVKDEFLAVLSHELRTPLAPILMWSKALLSGGVPLSDLPRALEAIIQSAESQSRLIEDLLDLSRLRGGKLKLSKTRVAVESVAKAAVEVIRPEADSKRIALELDVEPDLGVMVLDPVRFQQVLWNLLANAVKFTPPHGQVRVRVRRDDGVLEVEVSDTGRGITADFLPHLFKRFTQEDTGRSPQPSGLGVGLALSRHLVELQGGIIEASSEGAGKGAVFTVRLPWTEDGGDAVGMGTGQRRPELPLRGLRVLLVEDDANTRDATRWTLQRAGAEVFPASTGTEALGLLDTAEPGHLPNVIVCDLGLPGMSGFEFITHVERWCDARKLPRIPAGIVTAHAQDQDRERAKRAGFELYLTKPVEAAGLIAAVRKLGDTKPS